MKVVPVRVVPVVIAVCGALTIAGCGGGGAPAGAEGAGDPSEVVAPDGPTPAAADPGTVESCDLLTQEEAAAAAGNPVREGEDHNGVCIWEQEDYTDRSQLQVSLVFTSTPPALTAEQLCESAVMVLRDPEPVDGFGDKSYWKYAEGSAANTGILLVCLATGTMQAMAIGGGSESELRQVVSEMATTALGRL